MNFNDSFTSGAKELNDANVKARSMRSVNREYFRQKNGFPSVGQEADPPQNASDVRSGRLACLSDEICQSGYRLFSRSDEGKEKSRTNDWIVVEDEIEFVINSEELLECRFDPATRPRILDFKTSAGGVACLDQKGAV
jgi:hypothetical protein